MEASTLSEWRLHWKVLPPCVAGVMMAGIHLFSLGVMIGPLEREFGWTRAEISTGPMIVSILALLVAPLAGLAVDRFGARRIGLFGMVFFCAMLGRLSTATANIHSWWHQWLLHQEPRPCAGHLFVWLGPGRGADTAADPVPGADARLARGLHRSCPHEFGDCLSADLVPVPHRD
jgi:MFS family permease